VLTRLDGIDGIESSTALLANDGKRMVQIRIRPGVKEIKIIEEVRRTLLAEVPDKTPVPLEFKSAGPFVQKQDWLTIGQLKELAAMEENSSLRSYMGYWLLALAGLVALGAFLIWLRRRQKGLRQRSGVRLNSLHRPIVVS
jgi:hypothetical protein